MDSGLNIIQWAIDYRFELILAAVTFSGLPLTHDIIFGAYDGLTYFGSAAVTALLIKELLLWVDPDPKLAISLHKICGLAIIINCAGYILWHEYISGKYYSHACALLYMWAVYSFNRRDPQDDRAGGFGTDQWRTVFRPDRRPWFLQLQAVKAKI